MQKDVIRKTVKTLFGYDLTENQVKIVSIISLGKHKRVCINAYTRYGKSLCVAIGVALYILSNENKRICIIAPQDTQTSIIRNYIANLIISCPMLAELVDIERDNSIERLKKETSRARWTFKNGCELRTISAHGEANRLMGFGADLNIVDESALISRDAYAKIIRMLGDDPEHSMLIELSNPWSIDSKYYDHWTSGRFEIIHIGWDIGLIEGRTTQTFIDEVMQELTPIEFEVLYNSNFPKEMVDSLLKFDWVVKATNRQLKDEGRKIISCDVAGKGLDLTVIMFGYLNDGLYKIKDIYSEPTSDPMDIANRIYDWAVKESVDIINIDCIGIGEGVVSRVKEKFKGNQKIQINACHFGEAPESVSKTQKKSPTSSTKRFLNKKAEQYFRMRSMFEEDSISIPNNAKLKSELMKMRYDTTLSGKVKIIDPEEKSPDFADACCLFTWNATKEFGFFFG